MAKPQQTRLAGWPVACIVIAVGGLIYAFRRPQAFTSNTIWAEDGSVFLTDALRPGFDLFEPYNSAVYPLVRLLAIPISWLDPVSWPLALYLASVACATLCISTVLMPSLRFLFGNRVGAQVMAFAALILLPGVSEVQGNLANIQVWLALAVLLLLLVPEGGQAVRNVFVVVTIGALSLNGVIGALMLPVALYSVVANRPLTIYSVGKLAACTLAAGVNVYCALAASTRTSDLQPANILNVPEIMLVRVLGTRFYGEFNLAATQATIPALWILAAVAGLVTACYFLRVMGLWAAITLVPGLLWISAAVLAPLPGDAALDSFLKPFTHSRYYVLAIASLTVVLCASLARPEWRRFSGFTSAATTLAALTLLSSVSDVRLPALPTPTTAEDVARFQECLEGDVSGRRCVLRIAPPGWTVTVEAEGATEPPHPGVSRADPTRPAHLPPGTDGLVLTTLPGVATVRDSAFAAFSLPISPFPDAEHLYSVTGLGSRPRSTNRIGHRAPSRTNVPLRPGRASRRHDGHRPGGCRASPRRSLNATRTTAPAGWPRSRPGWRWPGTPTGCCSPNLTTLR